MSWFRKLFQKSSKNKKPDSAAIEREFQAKIASIRAKLSKFLITRSKENILKKTDKLTVNRLAPGLYKVESPKLSINILVEPFLLEKDGKLTGILRLDEANFCSAVHSGNPTEFLARSDALRGEGEKLRKSFLGDEESSVSFEDILDWEPFWIHQFLSLLSPAVLVHLLIHSSPEVEEKLKTQISNRRKELLVYEMDFLESPDNMLMNRNNKISELLSFSSALDQARSALSIIQSKRHKMLHAKD